MTEAYGDGIRSVVEAIERTGRPMQIRNGELNTRCPVCGDSRRSAYSKHFYINLGGSHPCFCQRCGFRSGFLTIEVLEALGAAERDAAVYIRTVAKEERTRSKRRKSGPRLGLPQERLKVPLPDRNHPDDAATIGYLEDRLGSVLEDREIQRYKIVTCGLYGFLELNGIEELTIHQREADRLNETCIGFLSADESYIIFRTMDDEHVKRGGRRYTNYRLYTDWEGSKSFATRADVDLLSVKHKVVVSEGIIDLIQVERNFHAEDRWKSDFVSMATCGTAHEIVIRQLFSLGILSPEVELYMDDEPGMLAKVRRIQEKSPFFQVPGFRMRAWRNDYAERAVRDGVEVVVKEKDFGVHPSKIKRVQVVL